MDTKGKGPELSVVVPVFNEEQGLPVFFDALRTVLDGCDVVSEIVFVNDGSRDDTVRVLGELQERDDRVVVVDLSRNFGHQAALTAGLDVARGEAVLTMDADLEHPPEVIPQFLEQWRAGAEIVFGRRADEDHVGWFKATTSRLFYRVFRAVADVDLASASPDFRLMDRHAADALRSMRERSRFLRGMAQWVGFRHGTVEFSPGRRAAGEPGYSLLKMIRFGVDGLLSFSKAPIRLTTLLGLMVSCAAFLYAGYALYEHLVLGHTVPGWTSTVVILSLLSGVQLLALGMMGEYVGQVYDEVKRRPIYIVRAVVRPAPLSHIEEREAPNASSAAVPRPG
jgi:dolichol-phosphate mannosyltransferase